jgi:oligopeptide transport system ATP-binding protein
MAEPIVQVKNLSMHFGLASRFFKGPQRVVKAVDNVSLDIFEGETIGLVGESGCGKSTLGRSILQLYKPTAGTVHYRGTNLVKLEGKALRKMRNRFQMIYQDPYASLNPRMKIADIIGEPMYIHQLHPHSEIRSEVEKILEVVGLAREFADRYPHEFSGGQRQRIGIARALAVQPDFIVADEPISALDVSIQAQIINLMRKLQQQLKLTYLFIAHDLAVVRHISDRMAVMYLGKVMELTDSNTIYEDPLHPYTQSLLAAIPIPDPEKERKREANRVLLEGEVPSPENPPTGCAFCTRCPRKKIGFQNQNN